MNGTPEDDLRRTPLYELHRALGARLVPFAGYEMPVQYPAGILKEHLQCREQAALFDVSHMGQVRLEGPGAAAALEGLAPLDAQGLPEGRTRYSFFTNAAGGILDDFMTSNAGDHLFLVVNAACKAADVARLEAALPAGTRCALLEDRALLALQGPRAAAVLARLAPEVAGLRFMDSRELELAGLPARVSRSGYTGEDGFEISLPADSAAAFAERLLGEPEVAPAGLGARDSLRLEAGLCLYGHDLDETTTPIEAGLAWAIGKRRRAEGGFPGAEIIRRQLAEGPARKRIGLLPEGRAPLREGLELADGTGHKVGRITSGGFAPSLGRPVAMGYVEAALADPGVALTAELRGKPTALTVAAMPFVKHGYKRS
ncbi:aminomethyltransferase [Tistlia consotensis]|uniref:aminomethyltransferase n=1 Tax=Tistlia consotensis USBA 355 TaxID=560819 RepID=A0A1Y6B6E1_9PROT|nr:glycine cleavage system aminomethyltransferase GcvT [Tistlia consotensis]SME94465.1 aminomethyltransferase [Tistlia consotensis USBA 355]SNR29359.1 aminomethyltransferase [Tistlia consotensis]